MKSITEILGDSQLLLDISYDIQEVFEDYLTHMHRSFLAMLRLIEDFIPPINIVLPLVNTALCRF